MPLQHFRGNLDNWDPALTDGLAASREVILVDYAGFGASTGEPARPAGRSARDIIAFTGALGLDRIDLLGFSLGGFVAQEIALVRPVAGRHVRGRRRAARALSRRGRHRGRFGAALSGARSGRDRTGGAAVRRSSAASRLWASLRLWCWPIRPVRLRGGRR
ncbi:alpha/beta fold hydrolase [Actinoplanes sp. NPDC000266]